MSKAVKVARAVTWTALLFPSPSPVPPLVPARGSLISAAPIYPVQWIVLTALPARRPRGFKPDVDNARSPASKARLELPNRLPWRQSMSSPNAGELVARTDAIWILELDLQAGRVRSSSSRASDHRR
jgi:hypothetical protein